MDVGASQPITDLDKYSLAFYLYCDDVYGAAKLHSKINLWLE